MNVISQFSRVRDLAENQPALISGLGSDRRCVTYAELDLRIDRAVALLRQSNLRAGDRVLLAVPLSIETYIAMLAILKAGLVVMFVDPAHGTQTLARCLRAHPPSAIVASPAILLLRLLSPELRRIPIRFSSGNSYGDAINICDGMHKDTPQRVESRSTEDSALLTFTSGGSGEPKAVVRTHGFLRSQFAVLKPVAELQSQDIDLVAMPMFVLFNLASGITSIIPACDMKQPARADPKVLTAQLVQEHATRLVASPALLERLARHLSRTKTQLPLLRRITTGGGPVGPTLPDRLQVSAANAQIRMVYGSTEAEPIACIDNNLVSITDKSRMREGAGLLVGRPVAGCDVRVLENHRCECSGSYTATSFASHTLAPGHIGEIVVSGKHVLQSYADVSRNKETKFEVDGTLWHRTGDAGYFDTLGRLWLAGRCDAAIHDARGVVYPFQVEYAVSALPAIRRAALIADNGKRLLVIEVSARRFATDCLKLAHCIAEKDIDRIITIRRIPMDKRHGAKVEYPALRRLLLGCSARVHHAAISVLATTYRRLRAWLKSVRAMAAHGRL